MKTCGNILNDVVELAIGSLQLAMGSWQFEDMRYYFKRPCGVGNWQLAVGKLNTFDMNLTDLNKLAIGRIPFEVMRYYFKRRN